MEFTIVRCIAHRLNHCLQKISYHSESKKAKKNLGFNDYDCHTDEDEDGQVRGSEEEEGDDYTNDEDEIREKKIRSVTYHSTTLDQNHGTITISQLPSDTKCVLITITECKDLVRYVKKVC